LLKSPLLASSEQAGVLVPGGLVVAVLGLGVEGRLGVATHRLILRGVISVMVATARQTAVQHQTNGIVDSVSNRKILFMSIGGQNPLSLSRHPHTAGIEKTGVVMQWKYHSTKSHRF